jgi:uncharacterized protein YbjT (DUF2867 family)
VPAEGRTIAVCGATGRQGGSVVRALIADGWRVRALTRKPNRRRAAALAELGAEVVRADMDDVRSLHEAFVRVHGVYSVQSGMAAGFEREVVQGRNVADAAAAAEVGHLVYASAGPGGVSTGVPSWDAKLPVEAHIRHRDVPFTILRPTAFMELMTDRSFYPAVGTWRIWPAMSGTDRPIPWLALADLGSVAATVFAAPDRYAGADLALAADIQTLEACRSIYSDVVGKPPRTFPMPVALFDRFTRQDPTAMWRWLRTGSVTVDVEGTRALLPTAMTVRQWLERTAVNRPRS